MLLGYTYFYYYYSYTGYSAYTVTEYGNAFASAPATTGEPSWNYLYQVGYYDYQGYWGYNSGAILNEQHLSFDGTNLTWGVSELDQTLDYDCGAWDTSCGDPARGDPDIF